VREYMIQIGDSLHPLLGLSIEERDLQLKPAKVELLRIPGLTASDEEIIYNLTAENLEDSLILLGIPKTKTLSAGAKEK